VLTLLSDAQMPIRALTLLSDAQMPIRVLTLLSDGILFLYKKVSIFSLLKNAKKRGVEKKSSKNSSNFK